MLHTFFGDCLLERGKRRTEEEGGQSCYLANYAPNGGKGPLNDCLTAAPFYELRCLL